jgi:hypothetical protein
MPIERVMQAGQLAPNDRSRTPPGIRAAEADAGACLAPRASASSGRRAALRCDAVMPPVVVRQHLLQFHGGIVLHRDHSA